MYNSEQLRNISKAYVQRLRNMNRDFKQRERGRRQQRQNLWEDWGVISSPVSNQDDFIQRSSQSTLISNDESVWNDNELLLLYH